RSASEAWRTALALRNRASRAAVNFGPRPGTSDRASRSCSSGVSGSVMVNLDGSRTKADYGRSSCLLQQDSLPGHSWMVYAGTHRTRLGDPAMFRCAALLLFLPLLMAADAAKNEIIVNDLELF